MKSTMIKKLKESEETYQNIEKPQNNFHFVGCSYFQVLSFLKEVICWLELLPKIASSNLAMFSLQDKERKGCAP